MPTIPTSHPAVRLGAWLRTARQARGIVKRIFAGQIFLSASKYSEAEAGVVRWIQTRQETAIQAALDLTVEQIKEFVALLKDARKAAELTFSNLFTRDQLMPVRLRSIENRPLTGAEKDLLLAAVFTPLV